MTASRPFTKMQGVGNDFVVVESVAWPGGDWAGRAVRLCDRRRGVGGDGLLVLGPSDVADVRMRMFNPDGTEDMCGNGLRCVVRLARERGLLGSRGTVETLAGVRAVAVHDDESITADMGVPSFAPPDLPMTGVSDDHVLDYLLELDDCAVTVSVVSTGTTHSVVFVEEFPGDRHFFALSPRIEAHPQFPERTSVLWAVVGKPDTLRLRIWERGAGETLGCGTGACAAAVLARVTGRLDVEEMNVVSKGGVLRVCWGGGDESPVLLSGPAEIVYTGEVSDRDGA